MTTTTSQSEPGDSVESRFAQLCKELGVHEIIAAEAALLLKETKSILLSSAFGSRSPEEAERYCFAFLLHCAAKLSKQSGDHGSTTKIDLHQILKASKLNFDDFFKEAQQFSTNIDQILAARYAPDWEQQLELKQLENTIKLLAHASRFYQKAYKELFVGTNSDQNILEFQRFGWLLFLLVRMRSPEMFKDLVSCIHGLVAVLAVLLVHVPTGFRNFTLEDSSRFVKRSEKGVELLASLCQNYHTSEDRLKEMTLKVQNTLADALSKNPLPASECKTENLDKINREGLMFFVDLLDEKSVQPNLDSLQKYYESISSAKELDEKIFGTNDENILGAESLSADAKSLCTTRWSFETVASPIRTITSMLTVPNSPSSPGSLLNQMPRMTPVSSAMTVAKWFREVISPLAGKPSTILEQFLSSCDRDLISDVTKRVNIVLEAIFAPKNTFDPIWATERKMEASKLYYRVLEAICKAESESMNGKNLTSLLSNERFHRCLLACSAELVLYTHKAVLMIFPAVLEVAGLTAFDMSKIIESFVRHEDTLPRELKRHLNSLEERLLESMAWEKGSSLYNSLIVARPTLAPEINLLGLLAEPMPSLDEIEARNNIQAEGFPPILSKKRAASPDQNGDARSPKRPCNEAGSVLVEVDTQTPPAKHSYLMFSSLKTKSQRLQSTFSSPTLPNPVGGGVKCAEIGIEVFYFKILKLGAIRIRNLCERLRRPEQTERVYGIFEQILNQQTGLFFNRHIDQVILCCLYGVAKVSQLNLTFKEIVNNYKKEPQCKTEVFRSVYVVSSSSNRNGGFGVRHVDIITFYNEIFVPAVKPLLVALVPSEARTEDRNNADGQAPGSPKSSPFSNLPNISPKKVSASHNIYVSPLRQSKMDALLSPSSRSLYACIGESTYAYQSPSKDLAAINNRLNNVGRRINSRINFDLVSDSVVAGSLGYQNGSSASSDGAATISPPEKNDQADS